MNGPFLSDKAFFLECLDPNFPGLAPVIGAAENGDFAAARKAFAAHVRSYLDTVAPRFFSIPYERAENIYTLPGESDADACRRICAHTLISCGIPYAFGEGNTIDWYSNHTDNNYAEWTWQLSRHNEWKLLAHEYRETANEALAECTAELFASWVKQAVWPGDVPGHETLCWRTIECGIRMGANWPYTLFSFYRSPAFTDDILVDWYKSLWEHGHRLSTQHRIGNWLIMEMNGLGYIGILYPQFKASAVWLRQAIESMEKELDNQVYPDGFQYELSSNYHHVLINNYQRFIELFHAFNTPLPTSLTEKLANAILLHIKLMMPDRTLPDINDGARLNVAETTRVQQRLLPGDERLRWVYENYPAGKPDYTSVALPWSGLFVMRTGWTAQDTWALLDAGPFGRGHQHEDKLSVLLYAGGKLLLTEAGNYAYDDSPMRRYVLSSYAHNTVLVDGKGQDRRSRYDWQDEDILKKDTDFRWNIGTAWDHGSGVYRENYDGISAAVIHRRDVYFLKMPTDGLSPLLVVADRLTAEENHLYEALWHIDSTLLAQQPGYLTFKDLDLVYSTGEAQVITGQDDPVQGFINSGLGARQPVPCACVAANAAQLRMVTVLAPYTAGNRRIAAVEAGSGINDRQITVTLEDGTVLRWDEDELANA